jgi:hypothetical protein
MGRSQPAGETRMETTSHTNEGNWKRKGVCKVGMEWKEGHPLCHLSNSLATHSPSSQLFSHHIVMTVHLPHWFMRHKSWDQGFIVSSPLPSYPTWWVPVWNAFASLQPALCHSQNWICLYCHERQRGGCEAMIKNSCLLHTWIYPEGMAEVGPLLSTLASTAAVKTSVTYP